MLEAESDVISYDEVLALVNKTISRQKKPPKEKKVLFKFLIIRIIGYLVRRAVLISATLTFII